MSHLGENLEVMISPSRLDDDSCNFYDITSTILPEIYRLESRSPPRLFPRTPPSLAMAVSRGSCRGRVLWCTHMPHAMLATPSHAISCTPIYPNGPPANVATLPAPINCTSSRSKWEFGLAEQGLLFEHFFLFQNFQAGWERLESIRF